MTPKVCPLGQPVTLWIAISLVLGALVVSQSGSVLSVLLVGAPCVIGMAMALTIVAGGRAPIPVSRLLHDRQS